MPAVRSAIAAEKKHPPVRIDIAYALVSLGSTTLWSILGGWLLYFYLPPDNAGEARVPAALYGVVILSVRVINAVASPPIGYLSDRTRTPWGRRLPFMAASALPMLVFFALIWMPPARGLSAWNLVYLAGLLLLYNLAYAFNQIPYTALLPEIAVTEHHRVRISGWTAGAFLMGMILGGLAGPLIDRFGYATTAVAYAGFTLPLFYVPFLVLRESETRAKSTCAPLGFREGIQVMMRNRAFQIMTATGICYWGVTTMIQAIIPYLVTEICHLTTAETFDFYVPALVASLLCYPLITSLSHRVGKAKVFSASLLASALVLPGLTIIGNWLPLPLKAQGLIWVTLQAVAMSGITMLPPAFGAEITDFDERLTGQRREGTYYATWGFLDQVIQGVAAATLPLILLLGRSRSDPQGPLGVRAVGLLGGTLMLAGFLIFMKYPLRHQGAEGDIVEL
ncbi:MAG: MFS transporter [Anaerolineae bacterium]